jgi:predicted dehydrogenase
MFEPVRIAIVGVKGHGVNIVRAAARAEGITLDSVCDIDADAARALAAEHGCRAATSLDEVLADGEVEAVALVTPNYLHLEQCVDAAEAERHVFVDKPIANTVAEARAMVRACEAAELVLMVGHQSRREAPFRRLKALVDDGALGAILQAECHFSHAGGLALTPDAWRWYRDKTPGGPLIQLGVHCIDTLQAILGPVAEVAGMQTRTATPAEIDDNTVAILRLSCGVLATLCSNYASHLNHSIRLHGTKATYCATPWQLRREAPEPEDVPVEPVDSFLLEMEEFARCVRLGETPETDGWAGLAAVAVVEAALMSQAERAFVRIEDVT